MIYKLIAIDLDGTMLNDEKIISNYTKEILHKINNIGVEIVIATGRRYWAAKNFVKGLDMNLTILANNGNIVREISDDSVLIKKYMDIEDFLNLLKEGRKNNLSPILHVDDYEKGIDMIIELERDDERYFSYMSKVQSRYKKIKKLESYKDGKILAVVYFGEVEDMENFRRYINSNYPSKYNSHIITKLSIPGSLLELMNPLGSKWTSLKEYAHNKGIKADQIIAIGDDNNDIEMIEKSGYGIAMLNSTINVKNVADEVTEKNNNEDGVAHVLRRIFKL